MYDYLVYLYKVLVVHFKQEGKNTRQGHKAIKEKHDIDKDISCTNAFMGDHDPSVDVQNVPDRRNPAQRTHVICSMYISMHIYECIVAFTHVPCVMRSMNSQSSCASIYMYADARGLVVCPSRRFRSARRTLSSRILARIQFVFGHQVWPPTKKA